MENKAGKGKTGKTKLEEEKREHDLELKHLKREVRAGNQRRESLDGEIKRGEKYLEQLKEYGKKMDEMRREECKRGEEAREELWKRASELQKHQKIKRGNYKTS